MPAVRATYGGDVMGVLAVRDPVDDIRPDRAAALPPVGRLDRP